MAENQILLGGNGSRQILLDAGMANRHGLITGATGTGKTVTLQVLAEGFSRIGVPVFMADVKGDLSGLALALAEWGEHDPARLTFLDPPPKTRYAAAVKNLRELGALDENGALTPGGREMARLPMAPPLAAMIAGAEAGRDRSLAADT